MSYFRQHSSGIVKLRFYSNIRLYLYCLLFTNKKVIINNHLPSRIMYKCPNYVDLDYVFQLFESLIGTSQTLIRIDYHKAVKYNYKGVINYTIKIDKVKEYCLKLYLHEFQDSRNYYTLSIRYPKSELEIVIFDANYYPHEASKPSFCTQEVITDNWQLGFACSQKIKVHEPLCMSCKYFTGLSFVKCAVNPIQDLRTCFDCRDYEFEENTKHTIEHYI